MTYSTAKNRTIAGQHQNANLDRLLLERHRFLGDHVLPGDKVLEIGAGIGLTQQYLPLVDFCQTDVEANPWIDVLTSGESLPFKDEQFDAVICIAALHHMDYPLRALKEMARVLKPSGKALIMEVHSSILLRVLLKFTGHEYVDTSVDPYGAASCQSRSGDNWDGNNAIGDLLFTDFGLLKENIPQLSLIHHRYTESLLFLNSGGVNHKVPYVPLPQGVLSLVVGLDKFLCRIAPDLFSLCQEIIMQKSTDIKQPLDGKIMHAGRTNL